MRRSHSILLFAVLLAVIVAAWLWGMRPKQVDMAAYAPANSLLYLEADHPIDVVEAVSGTQAWKELENILGSHQNRQGNHWLQEFIGWTGVGPVKSVVLARAQVAVVVTDLRTAEEGEALNIKPEGALLIETHTAESRVRPLFEDGLKTLAVRTYDHSTFRRVSLDGVEYSEWLAADLPMR